VEFNVCPGCSFRKCLKANDPKASCDVCDPISPERAAAIEKTYGYNRLHWDLKNVTEMILNSKNTIRHALDHS
jgi:hypothetical protein